jgi:tagatose-1,6-bisphosphate aldolase non-catalytic subunit AgaZ/GatZ
MKTKNKYWKSYYKGSASKINFLKFNSLFDRIRYYWNYSPVNNSKEKLFRNIDKIPKNYIQKHLIIDGKTKNILKKYKMKNSELIVFSFLRESLSKLYKACGFKVFC